MNKLLFVLIVTLFVNNTTCFTKPIYSYNNIKMRTETNKCWNIKINSNPENVYYDWLNNVWYDSYFNNNLESRDWRIEFLHLHDNRNVSEQFCTRER